MDEPDRLPAARDEPGLPQRHLTLDDLPPAVANRLAFDEAAPRRVRSDRLPPEVRDEFRNLWNDIIADVFDEVAGMRRRKLFDRDTVQRALARLGDRLRQGERALIVLAVHRPVRASGDWKHVAIGGAGGAGTAVAEEVAAYGSFGTGASVAVASAVIGELFEIYVTASARAEQYWRVGRSPSPDVIVADLAEAGGFGLVAGRRAGHELTREALSWLDGQIVRRTGRRFTRSLVPVVGVAAGAGLGGAAVRRVTKLPLRPPSEDEVLRLAHDIVQSDPRA